MQPAKPARALGWVRSIFKMLLWTVLVLVLLLALTFGFIQTGPGRSLVKNLTLDALNQVFHGRFEIDHLTGFLPFDARLEGVRLFDPDGQLVANLGAVSTEFAPFELLDHTIALSNLIIESPDITLLDTEGRVGFARALALRKPSVDPAPSPWVVRIDGARLAAGSLEKLLPTSDLGLEQLTLNLQFRLGPQGLSWPLLELNAAATGASDLSRLLGGPLTISTSGRFAGGRVELEGFNLSAGPHALEVKGVLSLGQTLHSELDIARITFDLNRLPEPIARRFGTLPLSPSLVTGDGRASLDARGVAYTKLTLDTPLGWFTLSTEAALDLSRQTGNSLLGDWNLDAEFLDIKPTDTLRERIPSELQPLRSDLVISARGLGPIPGRVGDGGKLLAHLNLIERHPRRSGEMTVSLERSTDMPSGPRFESRIALQNVKLDPWLELLGEHDLEVDIPRLDLEGRVTLAENGPIEYAAMTNFEGSARGTLHAVNPSRAVEFKHFAGTAQLASNGTAPPVGHVSLDLGGMAFTPAEAENVSLDVELGGREGDERVKASVRIGRARWGDIAVDLLEIPLELALGVWAAPDTVSKSFGTGAIALRGLRMGELRLGRVSTSLRFDTDGRDLTLSGPVSASDFHAPSSLSIASTALELHARLPRALLEGAEGPGPLRVRLDGRSTSLSVKTHTIADFEFDKLEVDIPLGIKGLRGPLGVRGGVAISSPQFSGYSADFLRLDLMGGLFLPTLSLSGSASLELTNALLPQGQTIARTHVTLRGLGDNLGFEGLVEEGQMTDRKPQEIKLSGVLTPPWHRRPLGLEIESLSVGARGEAPWFGIERGRLHTDGWLSIEQMMVKSPYDSGRVLLSGKFHPKEGEIELRAHSDRFLFGPWMKHLREMAPLIPGGLDPPPSDEIDGLLGFDLLLGGRLDAISTKGQLKLERFGWRSFPPSDLSATFETREKRIDFSAHTSWGQGSAFEIKGGLPLTLSFGEPYLLWSQEEPMTLELSVMEPQLARIIEIVDGFSGAQAPGDAKGDVDGDIDLTVKVGGTPRMPTMSVALFAKDFDFGETWKGGTLTIDGSARYEATGFRIELLDRQETMQIQVDAQLPLALPRLMVERFPMEWARTRLENREFLIELDLPEVAVAETPFAPLWPEALEDLKARVDLTFGGTLLVPRIDGTIEVGRTDPVSNDLTPKVDFETSGEGLIQSRIALKHHDGRPLLGGLLTLPSLASTLKDPKLVREIFRDPRFGLTLESEPLKASSLWDIDPGLGDLMRRLFPDGTAIVELRASGTDEGLVAMIDGTIATASDQSSSAEEDETRFRNLAEKVELNLTLARSLDIRANLTQTKAGTGSYLRINGSLPVTADEWVSGTIDFPTTAIRHGKIIAEGFRLEGLAASFRNILGGSVGVLNGDISISGTLAAPRISDGLCAQFSPLDVVPLGIEHERLALNLDFFDGTHWRLTKSDTCDVPSPVDASFDGCELDSIERGAPGDWRESGLGLVVTGTGSSLEPSKMSLGGCLRLEDYQALDTRELKGRINGGIDISGTIARPILEGDLAIVEARLAPTIASRNVRPVGPPLDVYFVNGPPKPRELPTSPMGSRSPIDMELLVNLPKDAVRIEPSLTLPLGEVRANLYPYTNPSQPLSIRIREGRVSFFGTIEVPKETVTIYGKNFTVDGDSRLVFRGNMASDPQLFFTARHNISYVDLSGLGLTTTNESEVVVRVTGTPMKPRLSFSSNPAMDETNILSVVALGVPAGGGAGLGEAVQSQLLTAMMGMATLQFARDFQRRLALDIMRVEARSLDPRETRLTVGKRLTRDLTLYYDLDPSAREGEDVNSGSLEYRITRFLSLLARAGDSNDIGLELNLRLQHTPDAKVQTTSPTK